MSSPITPARDAVEELERCQASWSRIEVLLRRLVTRLTYAADGRSGALDQTLARVRQQARQPFDEAGLGPLLAELADAVKALDETVATGTLTGPAADVESAGLAAAHPLLALLDRLRLDDPTMARLAGLRTQIAQSTEAAVLLPHAETLAGVVNRHCRRIGEDKAAAERLLEEITGQLAALEQHLSYDQTSQRNGAGDRQALDRDVVGEIQALDERVRSARDLDSLQDAVQSRLQAIGQHLKRFRQREERREREWQTRSDQMRHRIGELERATQSLETSLREEQQLAATDPLTGLANRLAFDHRMAQVCAGLATSGVPTSLLVLDIDRFKQINDSFGHAAGDRALCIVARQLRDCLRQDDLLARYGGEEFVAVLPGCDAARALQMGERLRLRIEQVGFHGEQQPVRITLSCGVTTVRPGDSPDSAFDRADAALYQAKREGRNRTVQR